MSKDTTKQSVDTESTSQHQSWEESGHPFGSMRLVFWLILTTPWIAFLVVIWPLASMLHKGRESASTLAESVGSTVKSGWRVQHTGVVPFLKKFEATVRCCTQNGIRGGSATVHFPIWHKEIEDILVLKNNKGTEDNRVRKLDYSIQLSELFYQRFIDNKEITLFSLMIVLTCLRVWGPIGLMTYISVTKMIQQSPQEKLEHKN